MKMLLPAVLVVGVLLSWNGTGNAQEGGQPLRLDLRDCIQRAVLAAPEVGEATADMDLAASRLKEAGSHRYPTIDFTGLVGPVPQARGDQVFSPDSINQTERWTYFLRGDVTVIQPLYTFGKIADNMRAATHGIAVDRAKREQTKNEVALKVNEYFYGLLLARELKYLVQYVAETLDSARGTAQKLLDQDSENVAPEDLLKLDSYRGEVAAYAAEAAKGETLALTALKSRIGVPPGATFDVAVDELTPVESRPVELATLVGKAEQSRPEFIQVREGLQAREALVQAARADYYPDFFLAGYLSGAYSEKRNRVNNPWIRDEFNHYWGGVALGLRWKIDFGITGAKLQGKRAELNRLQYTRDFAAANIPLQVTKYNLELLEAEEKIAATRQGATNAKKWVVTAVSNFDFGIGPAKEIFDALQQYAKMRAGYFQSVYNQRMSLAGLTYATGEDPLHMAAGK